MKMNKTKKDYENYLNSVYAEMDKEEVMDKLSYLTNPMKVKKTSLVHLCNSYDRESIGTLLRRLDPMRFELGYNEWINN